MSLNAFFTRMKSGSLVITMLPGFINRIFSQRTCCCLTHTFRREQIKFLNFLALQPFRRACICKLNELPLMHSKTFPFWLFLQKLRNVLCSVRTRGWRNAKLKLAEKPSTSSGCRKQHAENWEYLRGLWRQVKLKGWHFLESVSQIV